MDKVHVFLSTFNGERFLRQQVDGILNQVDVEVVLHVRDDGSTDGTRAILEEYSGNHSNVVVSYGENVGYIKSFMTLVENCSVEQGSYYAFADQDDIWYHEKLSAAVAKLKGCAQGQPALYYSDLDVVDVDGNFIRKANAWEGRIDKYMLAVFIGIRGCTMVYNDVLQSLLESREVGPISGHDTYVALVAFWLGSVVYDPEAYIGYRQTGGNVSITGTGPVDHLVKNFEYLKRRFTTRKNIHELNACELLKQYGDAYSQECADLRMVSEYRKSLGNRLRLLTARKFKNGFSLVIRMFNDVLIIFGKL